jgi:hypothetical protein
MGKMPHVSSQLQVGSLVAPFGDEHVARLGAFYVVVSENAPGKAADELVAWLHAEAKKDTIRARKQLDLRAKRSRR